MNYIQWAKLHPKQTLGYIRIQVSINKTLSKIQEYLQRLVNIQQGHIPHPDMQTCFGADSITHLFTDRFLLQMDLDMHKRIGSSESEIERIKVERTEEAQQRRAAVCGGVSL